ERLFVSGAGRRPARRRGRSCRRTASRPSASVPAPADTVLVQFVAIELVALGWVFAEMFVRLAPVLLYLLVERRALARTHQRFDVPPDERLQAGSLPGSHLARLLDQVVVDRQGQIHPHSLRVHGTCVKPTGELQPRFSIGT